MNLDPDKLRAFLAVVDHGSFSAAGRALGRATSVISYAIAGLESELGITLLDREGARRPQLTARGAALLPEIRHLVEQADRVAAQADALVRGLEPSLSLVVDVMFPMSRLAPVLKDFARQYPAVALRLGVEGLSATAAAVLDGRADLAISGPLIGAGEGMTRRQIGQLSLIPVAAPDHPLSRRQGADASRHRQLVLTDRAPLSEGLDFGVLAPLTWRLADLSAKHALLREGVGWGNMPMHMVETDLAAGALVRLTLPEMAETVYPLFLLSRRNAAPGPAATWMAEHIAAVSGG